MPDLARLGAAGPHGKAAADVLRAALDGKSKSKTPLRKAVLEVVHSDDNELLPIARDVAEVIAEAAVEGTVANRSVLLDVLRDLAVGYDPYTALAHGVDDVILALPLATDLTLRDLRKPIVERASALLPLLSDDDAKVRIAAAELLAFLPEAKPAKALQDALARESDPTAKYHQLFALAPYGVRAKVPKAPAKAGAALSIIARLVQALHGANVDPKLLDDTLKQLRVPTAGFPGGDDPNRAVAAGLVGEMRRRNDPQGLRQIAEKAVTRGLAESIGIYALAAQWPGSRTPTEPRSALTAAERAWLEPLFTYLTSTWRMPDTGSLTRYGIADGPGDLHMKRLLGLTKGAASELLAGLPAWLLARRVLDGRVPKQTWRDALAKRAGAEVVAIVKDLATYSVAEPWPVIRLPYVATPVTEAHARYFALVRETFAALPVAALEEIAGEERKDAHQATALASLTERGEKLPSSRDPRIKQLVGRELCDVEGLRTVLGALPEDRRLAILEDLSPDLDTDRIYEKPRLAGLWYYADLVPDAMLGGLVEHLVEAIAAEDSLVKPTSPKDEVLVQGTKNAIERAFRAIGTRAKAPLGKALKSAKAKAVKPFLELALAAAGGGDASSLPKEKTAAAKERPAATTKKKAKKEGMKELASLDAWSALTRTRRTQVRDEIAKTLGFRAGKLVGPHQLAEVVSKERIRFVVIPGGSFEMGMRDTDLARVRPFDLEDELIEHTRPVHRVTIRPFLCARSPLRDEDDSLLFLNGDAATEALAEHAGFRVMSEAEWEFVARSGGVTAFLGTDDIDEALSRVEAATDAADDPTSTRSDETAFGLVALHWGEFVADAWHADYDGAPCDGSAWDPTDTLQYWRGGTAHGYPYQEDFSIVECLAAFRSTPPLRDSLCLRLARDLP